MNDPQEDCSAENEKLKHQLNWLLEQYKKLHEEAERLREKVRTFYGT